MLRQHILVKVYDALCKVLLEFLIQSLRKRVLTMTVSQDDVNDGEAEGDREVDRLVGAPAWESAYTRSTRMDFGPVSDRMLNEFCLECADLMDKKRFDAMAANDNNLFMNDGSRFERDPTLSEWKRRWPLLSRRCVMILQNTCFTDMPLVLCEPELSYYCRLRDAIDANMEMAEGDLELQ